MEREIFICDCHSLEHLISFWYDEEIDSLIIEPRLITHKNFFKRLWVSLKYAFGYKSRFGEFDEVILGFDKQKQLYDWLNNKYNKEETEQTITLSRKDLELNKRNLYFDQVTIFDFKSSSLSPKQIREADIIIYSDEDGIKELKNKNV